MIARLRRANREQRKLLFSVGTNFLTRIPGAVGLLWLLPLLRFGLGTDDYANLLASMRSRVQLPSSLAGSTLLDAG